jgi:hypothetical protein
MDSAGRRVALSGMSDVHGESEHTVVDELKMARKSLQRPPRRVALEQDPTFVRNDANYRPGAHGAGEAPAPGRRAARVYPV